MGQQQSTAVIECDAECERQKRIADLKSAYTTSLRDETKDSDDVRQARKNYYTYAFGEGRYDNMESKALGKVADAHIKKMKASYTDLNSNIKEEKREMANNKTALKNMKELLDKFRASNNQIFSSLDKQESVLETSRRDVWYTNERTERLDYYLSFVSLILKIMMVVAFIFFLYDRKYTSLVIVVIAYLLIWHFL
jgi:chromosome segregation ATPase